MRRIVILMLALVAVCSRAAERPNIILIMADDMGFSDIGCFGSEIPTPNLDRLAAGGMRLTQFYNTARCCPTRAALLTGLYSHQAGVGHMVEDKGTPGYRGFLNESCVTIAEVLKPAGYATLMVGKWHVGGKRGHWPKDRGFERYSGLVDGGGNYFITDPTRTFVDEETERPKGQPTQYRTDEFSDKAVKYIEEYGGKERPFFLYLAYTAPHWPLHAPAETIAKHKGKYMQGWDSLRDQRHKRQIEMGIVEASWGMTARDAKAPAWEDVKNKEDRDLRMAVYAAQIEHLDRGIGQVMEKLRELKIEQNTLVIFLADNGGCAEEVNRGEAGATIGSKESFTSYGLPWANASNTPFRLYKHWVHEGGIASPLVAYWPAVIKPGQIVKDQAGHVIDLAATCYDLAGATYPKEFKGKGITPIEGKSLAPIFREGRREGHAAIYWEHEGNKAVRQGDLKLVSKGNGKWELYDLKSDRTEMKDLAEKQAPKVEDLKGLWQAWAERANVLKKK